MFYSIIMVPMALRMTCFYRECLDVAIDTPGFPSSSMSIRKNLVIRMTELVPEEL